MQRLYCDPETETATIDNAYLSFDPGEEAPIHGLLRLSITCRIETEPGDGQKLFTLKTLPAKPNAPWPGVADCSGFSQRDEVERLACYVSRLPLVAAERLSLTERGNVRGTVVTEETF